MRHQKSGRKLGRDSAHRKALYANLTNALIEHGRIKTTLAKAKEVRPVAEQMITLGKRGDLHAHRQAVAFLRSKSGGARPVHRRRPALRGAARRLHAHRQARRASGRRGRDGVPRARLVEGHALPATSAREVAERVATGHFALPLPAGWADRTAVTLLAPLEPDGFAPNVVVTREPLCANLGLGGFADGQVRAAA